MTLQPRINVEQWSGKDRSDENFPVGSRLIRRSLRPHVHAYYAFARNADDIADAPDLASAAKLHRLDTMQAVLLGQAPDGCAPSAAALRASLAQTRVTPTHATDLLRAFRQDAVTDRTASMDALMEYCRVSAMPVGRYLLDLHHEPDTTHAGSDALCASLQILNHLQDCASDLATMDRCYLPADMLARHGATLEHLRLPACTPPLRAVLDELLDHCEALNDIAATLAPQCRSRGMRLESAVILGLARRLARRLRRGDPLAQRVRLGKRDIAGALLHSMQLL